MLTLTPLRLAILGASVLAIAGLAYWAGTKHGAPKADIPTAPPEIVGVSFSVTDFSALAGWADHDPSLAVVAFARSCAQRAPAADEAPANPHEALGLARRLPKWPPVLREKARKIKGLIVGRDSEITPDDLAGVTLAGAAADWRGACAAAVDIARAPPDAAASRRFFEATFEPVTLAARMRPSGDPGAATTTDPKGRFTAYFEPAYPASAIKTPAFSAPVLARPADLVTVDLGAFREELAGERIAGAVEAGALRPYPDHAAINQGALDGRTQILAWMRPDDLLFLQIQGSGRLRLEGSEMRVGYDGHNGWKYTAVGKTLIEEGALTRETVSMQTIRKWLGAAPADEARRVRETNASYIFFRRLDDLADPSLGPLGADGAQLTPMVSLAVDPRFTPLGAPVWIDIEGPEPIRRLMIAQDRGGAIKGPVRGDLYAGSGDEAGAFAGGFNRMGTMTVLLPKAVTGRLPRESP